MKNKISLIFGFIFIASILIGSVSAAGIASPYWKDRPLEMTYGETKVINFNLQNMVGDEILIVKVEITQGTDIASLDKDTYTAEAGTHDTMIPVTIKIPKNYDKDLQKVELEVKTVTSGEGGMVVLGTGWRTSFNVLLSEKPISKTSLMGVIIALIVILVILAVIIFILIRRRK